LIAAASNFGSRGIAMMLFLKRFARSETLAYHGAPLTEKLGATPRRRTRITPKNPRITVSAPRNRLREGVRRHGGNARYGENPRIKKRAPRPKAHARAARLVPHVFAASGGSQSPLTDERMVFPRDDQRGEYRHYYVPPKP